MLLFTNIFEDVPLELVMFIVFWGVFAFFALYLSNIIYNEIIKPYQEVKNLTKNFQSICNNINNDLINTRDDLNNLYVRNYSAGWPTFLDFLYELKDRLLRGNHIDTKHYNPNELLKIKDFIDKIINEQNVKDPLSGIPDEDRASLTNILLLAEDDVKKKLISQEINKLTISIRGYKSEIKKESRKNGIATALAIIGIIATGVFSYLGKTSLSKENIEEININTKQQMSIVVDSIFNSKNHNIVINDSTLDESKK